MDGEPITPKPKAFQFQNKQNNTSIAQLRRVHFSVDLTTPDQHKPITNSRNPSHSATIINNVTSTPEGGNRKPKASCSTSSRDSGRRNRLSLDPNWKENLKRRRIMLHAELNDQKSADTSSPAKRWKNLEEEPGKSSSSPVDSSEQAKPPLGKDHQKAPDNTIKQVSSKDIAAKYSDKVEPISETIEIEKNQSKSESFNDTIKARIELKQQQLHREQSHKAYVDSLTDSIEQWKAGCIAALEDLSNGTNNVLELLHVFKIPPDLLGYDVDEESFK